MIVATLLLLCLVTWALSHAYRGLVHDAGLYTLQALAHLHPQTLAHDAFLRFGSQDAYTIFSPLYGTVIRLCGVEQAAALLTLAFQAALLAAAWLLARSVLPGRMALLGIVVLIAIPGYYGADRVFTCIEGFLTPRMLAEALVLAGVAASLRRRGWLALTLVGLAGIVHPIIAAAGVAALFTLMLLIPYPRAGAATALGVGMLAGSAVAAGLMPLLDPDWLGIVRARSPYLFLAHWRLEDWARCAVVLTTLVAGTLSPAADGVRRLCRAALIAALGGLFVTAIAGDALHVALLTQLQPWRCLWFATVVAALLLPAIVTGGWRAGAAARACSALLLAAWLFAANEFALEAVVLAVCCAVLIRRLSAGPMRWVLLGAYALLAVAVLWRLASNLEFSEAYYFEPTVPLWIRRTMSFVLDGSVPAAIAACLVWLGGRRLASTVAGVVLAMIAAVLVSVVPATWQAWNAQEYTAARFAQLAPLRAALPPDAEVFVAESPLATWLLLDRPSYLSVIQTSGLVFSRPAAIEFRQRAAALDPALSAQVFMGWNTGGTVLNPAPAQLLRACMDGAVPFLVTRAELGIPVVASAQRLRLYRCLPRPDVG